LENKEKKCRYSFEDIWHVLFTFDDREKLYSFAKDKLGLNDDQANNLSKIKLQQGYATLSLSAIKKIIPYLKNGFIYSHAVYLANLHEVLDKKHLTLDEANTISIALEDILAKSKDDRLLYETVKSLISDQLNNEYRYG